MKHDRSRLGYIPELNGLRGIAILGVMAFHADVPLLKGGFIGVDIFFVLSGFLITALLIQEFDRFQSISLKQFYARRVLRLAPALIAMLLLFCALSFLLLTKEKAASNGIDALISLFYLSNWARAFAVHPPDFLGHTWSLSIEEQFYVLWPLLLFVLLRIIRSRKLVAIAALSIALSSWLYRMLLTGATPERLYNGLDTRADPLMAGCVLGIMISSGLIGEKTKALFSKSAVIAPWSAAGLLGFAVVSRWPKPAMYAYGFVAIELLTSFLILDVMLNQNSFIRRLLAVKWLVWVGTISYGLYLWHYPVYRTMQALGYGSLIVVTVGSTIAFGVSAISYYYMESPVLAIKKRFTRTTLANGVSKTVSQPLTEKAVT